MNPYDVAHELAAAIRASREHKRYSEAKSLALEDETNKRLIDEYKKLQMKIQMSAAAGAKVDDDDMQKFQQLATLLMMNNDVSEFLTAELHLQRMVSELIKIVAASADIMLGVEGD